MPIERLDFQKTHKQCTYNIILKRVRVRFEAVEKQYVLNITSVYVCSLRVFSFCLTILSSVVRLALPYIARSPHKRHDFRKTILNIKYVS